jgi:hypothetical protein
MSLFVRPRLSTLAIGGLALGFAALNRHDPLLLVLFVVLGLVEVGLAFWNPSRRADLEIAAKADAYRALNQAAADAQKALAPVEAKGTQVLAEAKTLASEAQAEVKAVKAEVQDGLAQAQKVLSPTEKIAADIADELKKA